jgi:TRAP-type mannitol/chloroaromatic compound transport system permease small subunit
MRTFGALDRMFGALVAGANAVASAWLFVMMAIVVADVSGRRPAVGHAFGFVFHLAGACLMAAIMIAAWPKWLKSYDSGFYVGVKGVFVFPEWPMLLLVFLGCGLTALQFVAMGIADLHAIARRKDR